jgi:hypothetical protein
MKPALPRRASLRSAALHSGDMANPVLRSSARVLETPGKGAADTGDLEEQDIAELDLRSKHSRRRRHTGQRVQLGMGFLDRAKRISKRGIKGGIRAINDFRHLKPRSLNKNIIPGDGLIIPHSLVDAAGYLVQAPTVPFKLNRSPGTKLNATADDGIIAQRSPCCNLVNLNSKFAAAVLLRYVVNVTAIASLRLVFLFRL